MNNQSGKSNWIVPLIYILTAIGIPVAGATFSDEFFVLLTESPLRALALVLLYGFAVTLFGFVTKVWQRLESNLVDQVAVWLQDRVGESFSGYRQRYFQHLVYRHRDFDVKGLSTQGIFTLMLEDVFVSISIAPQVIHRTSADPIRMLETARGRGPATRAGRLRELNPAQYGPRNRALSPEGCVYGTPGYAPTHSPSRALLGPHDIWEFLAAEQMTEQNLAIIGPPGSGKTTLLQHITLIMIDRKKRMEYRAPDKLPILLFLRNHADAIKENESYSLAEAVYRSLEMSKMPDPPSEEWFEGYFKRGQCLVMLDGLDEVADSQLRHQVATWLEQQMDAYGNNRFIVTSRPFGYRSNPLAGFSILEVQPFNNKQVVNFIERWYLANEIKSFQQNDPGVRMKAQEGAQDLIQRVRNTPSLSALALNPLLLTMIATVHRYRSSLPERRVELYAEIADVFLGKRQLARGLQISLTPAQKQNVLQPLAYHMMKNKQREILLDDALKIIEEPLSLVSPQDNGKEFLTMIENSSGLLLERESNEYSFAHLTFQEYFAAMYVLEEQLGQELVMYVEESWWHETIRLYCARADATPIIDACLSDSKPSVLALTLAIECANEALKIQRQVRQKLETILQEGIEDDDPERRKIVAEAWLALHLKRMRRVSENLYVADMLITYAEYQLFLDDYLLKGERLHPDHWLQNMFPAGKGQKPVVGVRPSDAVEFCQWLTERDKEGWRYRLPYMNEFDLPPGLRELGYWTDDDTSQEYQLENKPQAILPVSALENRLRADYTRAQQLDLDNTRDLALIRAVELARALDLERSLGFDNDLARYLTLSLNLSLDRPLDLDNSLNLALDLDRDRNRVLALFLNQEHSSVLEMALDNALALDLSIALERALTRLMTNHANAKKEGAFLRWYARFVAWLITEALLAILRQQQKKGFLMHILRQEQERESEVQHLAEEYFQLYIDLAILEERLEGHLPAFEGIRVAKEWIEP